MQLLSLSQWRGLRRHPWLFLLSLLGVALGVAGVVAMDLSINSCRKAFQLSQQTLAGTSTHWLIGGPGGIKEQIYPQIKAQNIEACSPVVEGFLSLKNGQTIRILGLDPLVDSSFRGLADTQPQLSTHLMEPGAMAITQAEAKRLHLSLAAPVELLDGRRLSINAILKGLKPDLEASLQGQWLCDISVAQEALDLKGRLSRIELRLKPEQIAPLTAWLPAELQLLPAATRSRTSSQMSAAFFLNLQALSLLSLLVGALLIYNVIHFLVLQRRPWMARLRILGLTSAELRAQILGEAGWIGAWGSLIGVLLGIGLSRLLLPLMTRTINDLYYSLEVSRTYLSWPALLKGSLLGWTVSLLAAWLPAQQAATTPAIQSLSSSSLENNTLRWLRSQSLVGILVVGVSWLVLWLAERNLGLNLVAMVGLILGSASLLPAMAVQLQRILLRCCPGHLLLKIALGTLERSLSRLGVALIAMGVALSAVVSMTVMVHSFRISLLEWLDHTLKADLYIGQVNRQAAKSGQPLPPTLMGRLQGLPQVQQLLPVKMTPVYYFEQDPDGAGPSPATPRLTQLIARPLDNSQLQELRFVLGPAMSQLQDNQILASEPFLRQHRLTSGSKLKLITAKGPRSYTVATGFLDYASDAGYLLMDLSQYRRDFADLSLSGLAVVTAKPEEVWQAIAQWPEARQLEVRSQRALRRLSVEIFEQTFQVTRVLQLLAVLIATLGTLGAVAANQLERRRELALWECLGLTRWERWRIQWLESALCGLWAGLAAWPCGILQAYAMVTFINRRAFGWTLDFHLQPQILLATPCLGIIAASLATLIAIALRRPPAQDLRHE